MTTAQDFSPLVHAIGGSLGSALALLLLYPLERARIELQATVAAAAATDAETDEETKDDAVVDKTTTTTTISGNDDAAEEGKSSPLEHPPSNLAGTDPLKSPPPRTIVSPSHSSVGESESSSWTDAKAFLEEVEAPPPPPPSSRSTAAAPFQSPGIPTMQQPSNTKKQHESGSRSSSKRRRLKQQPRGQKMSVLQCLWSVCQKGELYRGAGPIVLTLATSNFVFFWIQSYLRQKQLSQHVLRRRNKSLDSLLASTLGGILNVLLTNPLWVANLRIVTKQASSDTLWGELAHLVQTSSSATELVSRLWQGTGSSLLLVSNPVLQFVCYEQVRRLLLSGSHNSSALSPAAAFGTGAASKALSTLVTYPLQLSQAVMRLQQKRQGKQTKKTRKEDDNDDDDDDETSGYRNTYDCLRQLYLRDGGYRGWYTGLRAKLLQTVLTAAFTFLTYEQILGAVHAVLVAQQERRRRRKTTILVS